MLLVPGTDGSHPDGIGVHEHHRHGTRVTVMTDSKSAMDKLTIGPENRDPECGIKV